MLLTPQQAVLPRAPYIKRPKLATTLQAGQENNGEAEQCCLDMPGRVTEKMSERNTWRVHNGFVSKTKHPSFFTCPDVLSTGAVCEHVKSRPPRILAALFPTAPPLQPILLARSFVQAWRKQKVGMICGCF